MRTTPRSGTAACLLAAVAVLAAACGQKEGVHVGFSGAAAGGGGAGSTVAGGTDVGVDVAVADGATEVAVGDPALSDPLLDTTGTDLSGTSGGTTDSFTSDPGSSSDPSFTGGASFPSGSSSSGSGSGSTGSASSGSPSGGGSSGSGSSTSPSSGGGGTGSGAAAPPTTPASTAPTTPTSAAPTTRPTTAPQQPATPAAGTVGPVIRIGFHAPLTGAAPIPQTSFAAGKDLYWSKRGQIHGRTVEVFIKDDKYNPASATQVCNELIDREKVFMLVGGGGTDQIAACARLAGQKGIPYLSAGVTEKPLDTIPQYFAFSMSYADQAPLLVQLIRKERHPQNNKVAMIHSDTPNFDDAVAAFKAEAERAGYQFRPIKLSKDPSPAELSAAAQTLLTEQITVAYPIMAPADWIQVAKQPAASQVNWVGVGITMGLNTVTNTACPEIDGSLFFSPWPGWNMSGQIDPEYKAAKPAVDDDIVWSLWGSAKTLDQVLTKAGQALTPASFMNVLETQPIQTGIYPDLRHAKGNHFGINQVHLLRADCGERKWVSQPSDLFKTGF